MYVLVLIMFHEANYKITAHDVFFTSQLSCYEFAEPIKDRLMNTRPSLDSSVNYYCFQIPDSA